MTNSKEKYIKVNINEEILNLCPDLEPEQQITLANIIDSEFNMEVIEDTVQYFCDENKVSGEKVWHMINSLSECKCSQFPYDSDYEEAELED